jgi:hypothetical protein
MTSLQSGLAPFYMVLGFPLSSGHLLFFMLSTYTIALSIPPPSARLSKGTLGQNQI